MGSGVLGATPLTAGRNPAQRREVHDIHGSIPMILAADVGGTKTLLRLAERRAEGLHSLFERRYADEPFQHFDELLSAFLDEAGARGFGPVRIEVAVLGVAGPVCGNRVRLTNRAWDIDGTALGAKFGMQEVLLVNDFVAAANGIGTLAESDLIVIQTGRPAERATQLVLGAGTGLGVAFRVWQGDRYAVIASEAGNAGYAPATTEQADLWRYIHSRTGEVRLEQVVSGPGLATIYEFLRERRVEPESPELARSLETDDRAAAIIAFAMDLHDPLARRALDMFIEAYGAAAGDQALAVVARGGVYIAGGIAPRIAPRLQQGRFLEAFRAKGRFADLMAEIPVRIVMNDRLGLLGATALASQPRLI